MENEKLYIVHDRINNDRLICISNSKIDILRIIYEYLKKEYTDSYSFDTWVDFIGKISDFSIKSIYINSYFVETTKDDFIISNEEYIEYMLLGTREYSLKKILDV